MIKRMSEITGVPVEVLLNGRRWEECEVRELCWKWLRGEGFSYPAIARSWGRRCHSTILSGVRRVEGLLEINDTRVCEMWERIRRSAES